MKPKGWSLETLFSDRDRVKARFQYATTRFNREGEPLNSIVLLQAMAGRKRYEFLGLVEIADSAWHMLVKRRQRLPVATSTAPEPH
jgi:hypothetical protein